MRACMHACMYACMCVYLCVCACVRMCACLRTCDSVCVLVFAFEYACECWCMCSYGKYSAYMFPCMRISVCICVYSCWLCVWVHVCISVFSSCMCTCVFVCVRMCICMRSVAEKVALIWCGKKYFAQNEKNSDLLDQNHTSSHPLSVAKCVFGVTNPISPNNTSFNLDVEHLFIIYIHEFSNNLHSVTRIFDFVDTSNKFMINISRKSLGMVPKI